MFSSHPARMAMLVLVISATLPCASAWAGQAPVVRGAPRGASPVVMSEAPEDAKERLLKGGESRFVGRRDFLSIGGVLGALWH